MLCIRPVRTEDHAEILNLAHIAGIGMSSLPQDGDVLAAKIAGVAASFSGNPLRKAEENFLFALEDTETRRLVGTTGIVAHVGLTRPFYSYKLSTITQASAGLGIYSLQQVLHMVNDYTDASEIGSLFLHPDYRRDGIGKMLSRCRYLMIAEFPQLFSKTVISEIRGVQDEEGNSPFYDNLSRHFFKMGFKEADYIYATQGAQFIADLMPKYPIYVNLLSPEAQSVIGVPLTASRPAMQILQSEGFRHEGYVDLFDAGPTLQANAADIRTVRKSRRGVVKELRQMEKGASYMISTTRLQDFTITCGGVEAVDGGVMIAPDVAELLRINPGDSVRYAL